MGTTAGAVTARITREFRRATPDQIKKGFSWYQEAHEAAEAIGGNYSLTLEQASAVIAAISPQVSWGYNLKAARLIAAGDFRGGILGANLEKAERIIGGEKISDVIGTEASQSGQKVRAFYRCILTAGRDERAVCVDRHAHALAVGSRNTPSLTKKRYEEVAAAYRRATRALNSTLPVTDFPILTPAVVQAVTWVTWRQRFWNEGAFDPKGI